MIVALPVYFYFQTLNDDFFKPFERMILVLTVVAPTLLLISISAALWLSSTDGSTIARPLAIAALVYAWIMFTVVIPAFRLNADADSFVTFKRHISGAWWLMLYLPTIAIVSWGGSTQFDGKGYLPYGWDLVVVAIVGLVFYLWGVKSGWRTPSIEAAELEAAHTTEPLVPPGEPTAERISGR